MAANREFYKGRRKRRNYALILFLALLGLLAVTVVLFYAMQKYAVISKEGINVVLTQRDEDSSGLEQNKEIWLVAQISCCVDALLPVRAGGFSLRTAAGMDYFDETGYWLDPRHGSAQLHRGAGAGALRSGL